MLLVCVDLVVKFCFRSISLPFSFHCLHYEVPDFFFFFATATSTTLDSNQVKSVSSTATDSYCCLSHIMSQRFSLDVLQK